MGDKKKKREKEREKEKDKKKSKKKDRKRERSSSSSYSSDYSSSSQSRKKTHKSKKVKKDKDRKHKKEKSKSQHKQVTSNNPYNLDSIPSIGGNTLIKGSLNMPTMLPPAPNQPQAVSVSKPKTTKEPNIYKILPRLNYGPVLYAKTLYSSEFIEEEVHNRIISEMCADVERKLKEEDHKKGFGTMAKCVKQLERCVLYQKEKKEEEDTRIHQEKDNQYDRLEDLVEKWRAERGIKM